MVRIRIGEGWASDPEIRAGLRAGSLEPRRAAIRSIVDVLAVEVEGVDIGAGRTEGPLAEGVLGMLLAVNRLAAGEEHGSVPFDDGAVELLLHRRGGVALLSVATLSRPARLLAHDVEVDLPRLAEAARAAVVAFCDRVWKISPAARALPELRRLLLAASRSPVDAGERRASGAAPRTRTRRTRRRLRDAACSFELHDETGRLTTWRGPGADLASLLVRGRVSFRAPSGDEFLSLAGAPYLLFRDLCAAASRMAAAPAAPVTFDLARPGRNATARVVVADGTVTVDGADPVPCDSLAFAHAALEGATDFCAVIRGRAPCQAENGLLSDLERTAATTLAQVVEAREGDRTSSGRRRLRVGRAQRASPRPLGAGRLRRVSFRHLASFENRPAGGGRPLPPGRAARRLRSGPDDRTRRRGGFRLVERSRLGPGRCRGPDPRPPSRRDDGRQGPRQRGGPVDPPCAQGRGRQEHARPGARRARPAGIRPVRLRLRRRGRRPPLDVLVARRDPPLPPARRLHPGRGIRCRDGPRHRPCRASRMAPARRGATGLARRRDRALLPPVLPDSHGRDADGRGPVDGRAGVRGVTRLHASRPTAPLRRAHRHRRTRRRGRRGGRPGGARGGGLGGALAGRGHPLAGGTRRRAPRQGPRRDLRRARPGRQDDLASLLRRSSGSSGQPRAGSRARRGRRRRRGGRAPRRARLARWSGGCRPSPLPGSPWTATSPPGRSTGTACSPVQECAATSRCSTPEIPRKRRRPKFAATFGGEDALGRGLDVVGHAHVLHVRSSVSWITKQARLS